MRFNSLKIILVVILYLLQTKLTEDNNYIVIGYTIKNGGDATLTATHTLNEESTNTLKNYEITYSTDGFTDSTNNTGFTIPGNGTGYYYVKIKIDDLALNSNLNG